MAREKTHLVILIHGLFGSTSNLDVLAEELVAAAAGTSRPYRDAPSTPAASPSSTLAPSRSSVLKAQGTAASDLATPVGGRAQDSSVTEASSTELRNGAEELLVPERPASGKESSESGGEGAKDSGTKRQVAVYNCNSFGWGHTWDGVDVNAERAADEVRPYYLAQSIGS